MNWRTCIPLLACTALGAGPITIDVRPPAATAESTPCPSIAAGAMCTTTPYISTNVITGADVVLNKVDSSPNVGAGIPYPADNDLFYEAWNAWDTLPLAQGGGGQGAWQLMDGTNGGANNLGGKISVFFSTQIWQKDPPGPALGGVSIQALTGSVTGLPKLGPGDQLVWAQGLYVSYNAGAFTTTNNAGRPGPDLSNTTQLKPPAFFMDVLSPCGATYTINLAGGNVTTNVDCAPAYPFTDIFNQTMIDQPAAAYPNYFAAEAFLGIINYNAKTLKIYDGFDYGFNNTVTMMNPEPASLGLCAAALALLWLIKTRIDNKKPGGTALPLRMSAAPPGSILPAASAASPTSRCSAPQ